MVSEKVAEQAPEKEDARPVNSIKLIVEAGDGQQYEIPLTSLNAAVDDDAGTGQKAKAKRVVNGRRTRRGSCTDSEISDTEGRDDKANGVTDTDSGDKSGDEDAKDGEQEEPKKERGSTLEYKRLDYLFDSKTYQFYLAETTTPKDRTTDEYEHYAFVVRRLFTQSNEYKHTVVDIKSLELKTFLQKAFENVSGLMWTEDKPCFTSNFIFLKEGIIGDHLKSLQGMSEKSDEIAKQISEAELLLKFVEEDFKEIRERLKAHLEEKTITFDLLGYIIHAETILIQRDPLDEPMIVVTKGTQRKTNMKGINVFSIEASYLLHEGKNFKFQTSTTEVPEFQGIKPITSLFCYPFEYDPHYEELKEEITERGKKFCRLNTPDIPEIPGAYRSYRALAYRVGQEGVQRLWVDGRVMVDSMAFKSGGANKNPRIHRSKRPPPLLIGEYPEDDFSITQDKARALAYEGTREPETMSDMDFLLCESKVDGFSFSDGFWLHFSVRELEEIKWNEGAFDSLVLPANQKIVIRALIESHTKAMTSIQQRKVGFDDIIQGKGRGLVILLHGRPGLGKTLTAESISETLKRPLYFLSSGELPTDPGQLELQLAKTLALASSWGAVLLIDEADIYLEQRSIGGDIRRNALVCVFLRQLEYFQGIMILTSNRVTILDEAFQSRIHVALAYEGLGKDAKIQIWKTFIEKALESEEGLELTRITSKDVKVKKWATSDTDASELTADDYEQLARYNLNGRQIKNIVHTAHCLATSLDERLNLKHIRQTIEVTESFERAFKGAHTGNLYT